MEIVKKATRGPLQAIAGVGLGETLVVLDGHQLELGLLVNVQPGVGVVLAVPGDIGSAGEAGDVPAYYTSRQREVMMSSSLLTITLLGMRDGTMRRGKQRISENRNNENDKRSERTGAWKIQEQEKTNRLTTAQTVVTMGQRGKE